MQDQVLISVVTVSYNAVTTIEQTILSVINQTYPHIEYIIIDGGSTDGTVDVIKKYADKIVYWVSEPDKGIYDAMNKGVREAKGKYITFLNAGDFYYNQDSLLQLIQKGEIDNDPDVIYGYQIHSFNYGKFVRKKMPLVYFKEFMPIGHPFSFVKADLMKNTMFDCSYRIAADYNFLFGLYQANKKFKFVDVIIADFESMTGISSESNLLAYKETAIINGCYGTLKYKIRYLKLYLSGMIKKITRLLFPKLALTIQKRKRRKNKEYLLLDEFLLDYNK